MFLGQVVNLPQVLAIQPDDKDALQCKVACLLEQGSFEDVLALVSDKNQDLALHRAYALFRLHKIPEALAICETLEPTDSVLELKAQAVSFLRHSHGTTTSSDNMFLAVSWWKISGSSLRIQRFTADV